MVEYSEQRYVHQQRGHRSQGQEEPTIEDQPACQADNPDYQRVLVSDGGETFFGFLGSLEEVIDLWRQKSGATEVHHIA